MTDETATPDSTPPEPTEDNVLGNDATAAAPAEVEATPPTSEPSAPQG